MDLERATGMRHRLLDATKALCGYCQLPTNLEEHHRQVRFQLQVQCWNRQRGRVTGFQPGWIVRASRSRRMVVGARKTDPLATISDGSDEEAAVGQDPASSGYGSRDRKHKSSMPSGHVLLKLNPPSSQTAVAGYQRSSYKLLT